MLSVTNFFSLGSIATFRHWSFEFCLLTLALCSAFSATYFPFTLFTLISSEMLDWLRSNFPAMNLRLFPFLKKRSILFLSKKQKCLKFSIKPNYRCSDSKVNFQYNDLHQSVCVH